MATSIPLQLAETIQTAHMRPNPSVLLDAAPSTAADRKEAVVLEDLDDLDLDVDLDLDLEGDDEKRRAADDDDLLPYSYSAIRPWKPHHGGRFGHQLPALPDLRFEQSYLHSVARADRWWKVALITARDQMVMPFTQGLLYNLAVCGWQFWNRNAQLSGQTVGARVRRWWYGVNGWSLPQGRSRTSGTTAWATSNRTAWNRR
ncbi:duf1770 domain containing protein [Grosmannia clavigera kw1407]|uniref:Duf1770 domain containing protein n=1 Tax=Grosmannia clavigera (strain kw1407 / UAMH 11150) TaxID=655863 RepID=F0XHM0_GROCL|nr:duf1770 domain containing protein [Grosmannia clavigera kw1407]EFX02918.1 duf1770 domain containing protein [Grosmannia clavigera kw1407]